MGKRLTITLSDETQALVAAYAQNCGLSKSRAAEEMIRRSAQRKPRIKIVNGLAVFDVELKNGPLTTEQLLELEDQAW